MVDPPAWGALALTPQQEWAIAAGYQAGVNLGGWLVIEPWMWDQQPFAGASAEQDVVSRLRSTSDAHAIQTMRNHWAGFVDESTLRLLADFGITHVRIPVGYWMLDAPMAGSVERGAASSMYDYGFQQECFVTGGINYLDALLQKLPSFGMRAVIDMHAMPGCSSKCQGYAGISCSYPTFWTEKSGTPIPGCAGGPTSSKRNSSDTWLDLGVTYVQLMAEWIDAKAYRSSSVVGLELINEPALQSAGLADNIKEFLIKAAQAVGSRKLQSRGASRPYVVNFVGPSINDQVGSTFVADQQASGVFPQNTVVDTHHYYNWNGWHDAAAYEQMVCNGDEDWWQYGAQKQSVFIGEWSVAVNGNANLNSFDSASDVAFMRRFYANQVSYYYSHEHTVGNYYWNFRMASGWNPQPTEAAPGGSYVSGTDVNTSLPGFGDRVWSLLSLINRSIAVPLPSLNIQGRCHCHGCSIDAPPAPPAVTPPSPPAPPPSPPSPPSPPHPPPSPPNPPPPPSWDHCRVNCNDYQFDDSTQVNIGIIKPADACGEACQKKAFLYYKFFSDSGTCICYKTTAGSWPPDSSQCGGQGGTISSGTVPGNHC